MKAKKHSKILIVGAAVVCAIATTVGLLLALDRGTATASTRLIQPMASVVPEGKILEVEVTDSGGRLAATYLVDPHAQVCVQTIPGSGGPSRPYAAILVCDAGGQSELNGVTLEVYENNQEGLFSRIESKLDALGGQKVQVLGTKTVDDIRTTVVEGQRIFPEGGETEKITGYVDGNGLVVREEISAGGEKTVLARHIVAPESQEFGSLTRGSLKTLAENLLRERLLSLAQANFPVLALPKGEYDLALLSVKPSGAPDYVRIDYQISSAPGRSAAAIRIWDLSKHSDFSSDDLVPLEQAKEEDLDSLTRVRFRYGNSAVQVFAEKEWISVSASELAAVLVPLADSGLF